MQTMNRDDVIIKSVKTTKTNAFGGTAIKVELEATFNRRNTRSQYREWEYCDYCDEGNNTCANCDGNYDNGDFDCQFCNGDGQTYTSQWYAWNRQRQEAESTGAAFGLPEPDRENCGECAGSGSTSYCPDCEEGYVTCNECDGEYRWHSEDDEEEADEGETNWADNPTCHAWLMKKLAKMGLAEYRKDGDMLQLSHGVRTRWHPKGALKYAEFYTDGSVDSEFTFTISLEKPENIFLLPKFIELWNELGVTIGQGVELARAGMHMAILQSPDCKYPIESTAEQMRMFNNYSKSMNLLMPALFFLGSNSEKSRGMRFRMPQASRDKYSAIHYFGGALEFRVFNTCYDNPASILDNFVVMANTLKYWSKEYKPTGLSKVANVIRFGNDDSDKLERFYVTEKQIDLLNAGLKRLKPAYYTIKELKKQRAFNRNRRVAKLWFDEKKKQAEEKFRQYEARERVDRAIRAVRVRAEFMEQIAYSRGNFGDIDTDALYHEVEDSVQDWVRTHGDLGTNMEQYVASELRNIEERIGGTVLREDAPQDDSFRSYQELIMERMPF